MVADLVGVFWDMQTVSLYPTHYVPTVVKAIREQTKGIGKRAVIKAYRDQVDAEMRGLMKQSCVDVTESPRGTSTSMADKILIAELLCFASDHPSAAIVLITSNADFGYVMALLNSRGHTVTLVTYQLTASRELKAQAENMFSWVEWIGHSNWINEPLPTTPAAKPAATPAKPESKNVKIRLPSNRTNPLDSSEPAGPSQADSNGDGASIPWPDLSRVAESSATTFTAAKTSSAAPANAPAPPKTFFGMFNSGAFATTLGSVPPIQEGDKNRSIFGSLLPSKEGEKNGEKSPFQGFRFGGSLTSSPFASTSAQGPLKRSSAELFASAAETKSPSVLEATAMFNRLSTGSPSASTSVKEPSKPAKPAEVHPFLRGSTLFTPHLTPNPDDGAKFLEWQSISAMPEYSQLSPEEIRVREYVDGIVARPPFESFKSKLLVTPSPSNATPAAQANTAVGNPPAVTTPA